MIRERDAGVVDRRAGLKRDSGRELTSYCIGLVTVHGASIGKTSGSGSAWTH